jgi:two-component system, OmpR family, phosphate regulon sensor histidine kinase PhoR
MKKTKPQLTILILTLACLISLVSIQILWILKAAKMQEVQFSHSVNMAMNRIVENLAMNKSVCREMKNCMKEGADGSCFILMRNRQEWSNIDSMIRKDLKYYGITLDFEFDIIYSKLAKNKNPVKSVYFSDDLVNALQQTGYELRIKFPEKRDFIIAQIGYIFIFSIVLLILVTLSFIMIYGYYKKEKKLTENIVDFVNNMTHEFKTPLTNIALANSMISRSETVELNKKLSFYSQVIKSEHDKLKLRVEELLKASFSETGAPLFNESIDVCLAIEYVIEAFSVQIMEKGGSFSFTKEGNNFMIQGNTDLFNIALGNIIDNAIKYCTSEPKVNISAISTEKSVLVEISDNGIGIAKDQRMQIFEKYYRVPTGDVHNNNGFGLGLYHVKNIITRMKGKIKVAGIKRNGTIFSLEFPVSERR